jgi:4-hydroxy-tetrahydrodipicolinate synthase
MFTGVITALVTPFRNGAVDEDALRNLVDEQIAAGVDGLIPCGTTGESATLDYDEHMQVVRILIEEAGGRVPVIAGTGSNSTREAIELSRLALEAGADGMLQVTPYYNKPTQDGLYRHFRAICEAVPLPTIVYNVPGRTGVDMSADTVARLCDIPQVVGVKEATGSAQRASDIIAKVGDRLAVISGDDATAINLYVLGGKGVISVSSNVAPREMSGMWDAAAAGNWARALELHLKLLALNEGLFVESKPIPVKAALAMMGRMADELRSPLFPLADQHRPKLRAILADLGLVPKA